MDVFRRRRNELRVELARYVLPAQLKGTALRIGLTAARALAAGTVAAAVLVACGGVSQRPQRAPATNAPQVRAALAAALAAFERDPGANAWLPLHAALLRGPIAPETESRIVRTLSARNVARNVVDAAAVDLATLDWGGAMQWVQKTNLAARDDASPRGVSAVWNSSALAWLMLVLRPAYAGDPVDLTHADLRFGAPPPHLALNLEAVDFSRAILPGGTWYGANLTGARFDGSSVAGVLRCTDCTFGTLKFRGTAVLSDGTWLSR